MIWTLRKFAHRTKDVVRFYEQILEYTRQCDFPSTRFDMAAYIRSIAQYGSFEGLNLRFCVPL